MDNYAKVAKKAHKKRLAQKQSYKQNVEPTEVNGIVCRSRLEALWVEELSECESFKCIECVQVPIWIDGPFQRFLSNYKPDIMIEDVDGNQILIELKPTTKLAMGDDRQQRALELNPRMKFVVIGGYPYSKRGVTVRLLTGSKEIAHHKVDVCNVLDFLGCKCGGE